MKKWNELNSEQQVKALIFIESELRAFMENPNVTIYFKDKQNDKQIRGHAKKIATNTVYDNNGKVLIEESLRG